MSQYESVELEDAEQQFANAYAEFETNLARTSHQLEDMKAEHLRLGEELKPELERVVREAQAADEAPPKPRPLPDDDDEDFSEMEWHRAR